MNRSVVHCLGAALAVLIAAGSAMGSPNEPAPSIAPDTKAGGVQFSDLDRLTGATVMLETHAPQTDLAHMFEGLGKAAGFKVELKSVPVKVFSMQTGKITVKDTLIRLARDHGLTYEVIGTDKLVVNGPAERTS